MSDSIKPSIKRVRPITQGNPNDSLPTALMDDTVVIMDDPTAVMGQPASTASRIGSLNVTLDKPRIKR